MVKLTNGYLTTQSSGVLAKKNKVQSCHDFLRKKTQLRLHDQRIDDIGDFSICKNLTVLYLHNNCLTEIKHLDHAINLTHLYLQNNKISKIENLENLTSLTKLYLGFNEISVLEGLEAQDRLEELHLEKQRLPEGEELHFDPRSVGTLTSCLRVLDVSGCGLRALCGAAPLLALERLRASGNTLAESASLAALLESGAWPRLRELDVRGSPAAQERRHRVSVVAAAPASFELLDGREVAEAQRHFMRGLQRCQRHHSDTAVDPEPLLRALAPEVGEMALRLPPAVRRAVSRSLLEETAVAAAAFDVGVAAGGAGGGVAGRGALARAAPLALPMHSVPLRATFPPWRRPVSSSKDTGGGGDGAGDSAGTMVVAGAGTGARRPRTKVPRPFWRQRLPTAPRSPPARATASCPLRLPDL